MNLQYGNWHCTTKNGQIEYITPPTINIMLNQYDQYLGFLALVKKLIESENQLPACFDTIQTFFSKWLEINNLVGTIVINNTSEKAIITTTNGFVYVCKVFLIQSISNMYYEQAAYSLDEYINFVVNNVLLIKKIEINNLTKNQYVYF